MDTNYYLTPTEQKIVSVIDEALFIDKASLKETLPEVKDKNLDKCISSLIMKGELLRLKNGFYVASGKRGLDTTLIYKAAPQVYGGYIAFDTALKVHELLDYETFTIMVATPKRSGIIALGAYEVQYVSIGTRCRGQIIIDDIWVSDLEKTIFDCFYKPQHSGGYQNLTKALLQMKNFSWEKFGFYLNKMGTDPMRQRVGFIVSNILDRGSSEDVDAFLSRLKVSVRTPTRLAPSLMLKGKMDREWKVQDNLGPEVWRGGRYGF